MNRRKLSGKWEVWILFGSAVSVRDRAATTAGVLVYVTWHKRHNCSRFYKGPAYAKLRCMWMSNENDIHLYTLFRHNITTFFICLSPQFAFFVFKEKTVTQCVFWLYSIRTNTNFLTESYEPWPARTISQVCHCPFFRLLTTAWQKRTAEDTLILSSLYGSWTMHSYSCACSFVLSILT